jgi:outer membrane protein assembly factor BamD
MRFHFTRTHRLLASAAVLFVAVAASGCAGSKKDVVPGGIAEADKFLFEKGTEALDKHRWYTAREFFSRLVDNYPQSPYRPDAKLGVGDTYLGEGSTQSYVLAENEFKEFLTFYPTSPRADYAQYKLAMSHYYQMRDADRDQSQTREAVHEFQAFVERYPNSALLPEVRTKLREARDRLSESEYNVGYFYYRQHWYPGAIDRFKSVLKEDPGYTGRDALYYYLGESLLKIKRDAEALPYFDRLVKEFETSEYLVKARERLDEYKAITPPAADAATAGTPTPPKGASPADPPSSQPVPLQAPPVQPPAPQSPPPQGR